MIRRSPIWGRYRAETPILQTVGSESKEFVAMFACEPNSGTAGACADIFSLSADTVS
jgi:hypothetical protein